MFLRLSLRSLRQLAPLPLFKYSTAPTGNAPAFKFPRRWQMKVAAFDQVFDVIHGLTQYKQFATVLKDNLQYFTDEHMGQLYKIFGILDLELDNHYYDVILPITKEYIKKYTFQDADSLCNIIQGALVIKVQDEQFWDLILHKLHKERCARYINLPDVLTITEQFLAYPKLNQHPVMSDFAKILNQQKNFFATYSHADFVKAEQLVSKIDALVKLRLPEQKLLDN